MVSAKFLLIVGAVAIAQINAKPAESSDWSLPFEKSFQDIAKQIKDVVTGSNTELIEAAKTNLNKFQDQFRSGLASLSDTIEKKTGESEVLKDAVKQWKKAVDTYNHSVPADLTADKLNEKYEKTLKYIKEQANDVYKKAQGNSEVEKDIRDFTKKQLDYLIDNLKTVQTKVAAATKTN
ncbi:uncharacterized protein LOC126904973 [Daktulosphaira vitifoliae]|uniref:uncharacterized protein LOC126904973 n=1 Tax=Daktulosphaira vitifoliae TaxID=58002 RepID=UPI0021AA5748|nr:uncharacterized protein LOC126904973 [Daktulosphaira vitifoliae]